MCNVKIHDAQCGYRLYDVNIFNNFKSYENGYLFESEILINCINNDEQLGYVNINTIYGDSISNINTIKDTLNFIKLILTNLKIYANNR